MKEKCILIVTLASLAFLLFMICGCQVEPKIATEPTYDPNDAIYKFIPEADPTWIDRFGDTDDTRIKHTISEIRVVVAAQGEMIKAHDARLKAIETTNELGVSVTAELTETPVSDPNEVKE